MVILFLFHLPMQEHVHHRKKFTVVETQLLKLNVFFPGNLFRWRPNVQKRERYSRLHKGAKMDELLKDTARGHVILVENLKIKKVFSVNLLNH